MGVSTSDCNQPPCKGKSNPPGCNHQNFQCQPQYYHHPPADLISTGSLCAMVRYYIVFFENAFLYFIATTLQHNFHSPTIYKTLIKAIQETNYLENINNNLSLSPSA